jgi:hypothetical protein
MRPSVPYTYIPTHSLTTHFYRPAPPNKPLTLFKDDTFEFEVLNLSIPEYPEIQRLEGQLSTGPRIDRANEMIEYKVGIRAWFRDNDGKKVVFRESDGRDDVCTEGMVLRFRTSVCEIVDNSCNRDAVVGLLREVIGKVFDGEGEGGGEVDVDEVEIEDYGVVSVETGSCV